MIVLTLCQVDIAFHMTHLILKTVTIKTFEIGLKTMPIVLYSITQVGKLSVFVLSESLDSSYSHQWTAPYNYDISIGTLHGTTINSSKLDVEEFHQY